MADMTFRQKKMKTAKGPHNLQRDNYSGNDYEQMHGADEFFVVGDSYASKCKDCGEPGDQTVPALNAAAGYNESQLKTLAKVLSENLPFGGRTFGSGARKSRGLDPQPRRVEPKAPKSKSVTPQMERLVAAYSLALKTEAEKYGPAMQALWDHGQRNMKYVKAAQNALERGIAPEKVAKLVIDAIIEREGGEEAQAAKTDLGAPQGAKQIDATSAAKAFAKGARRRRG